MPVDPHIAAMLDLLAAAGTPPMSQQTPDEARAGFRALTVGMRDPAARTEVASVEEVEVPGGAGPRPARVYRPLADGPLPTIVMFHGGGFTIGDLDTHDGLARTLASGCEAVVVSVDYRLAPEHPWPAGVEDAIAATRWAASTLHSLAVSDPGGQHPSHAENGTGYFLDLDTMIWFDHQYVGHLADLDRADPLLAPF